MSAVTKALLVEGRDDKHVVWCLLEHHAFPEVFEVFDKEGADNIMKILPVQIKASGLEVLGIVVDADIDISARWEQIRTILLSAGYHGVPQAPVDQGTIVEGVDLPRVGVWLMPDNTVAGMLEHFIASLVPAGDAVLPAAKAAVASAAAIPAPFKAIHQAKAEIHTWLAWQDDPGTPLGLAITKKYLNPNAESAAVFLKWLESLFVSQEVLADGSST